MAKEKEKQEDNFEDFETRSKKENSTGINPTELSDGEIESKLNKPF